MAVSEDARHSGLLAKRADQRIRKARNCFGKVTPIERHRHACDFPVAGRSVLAFGSLAGAPELRAGMRLPLESGRPAAGCEKAGFAKPKPKKIRDLKRSAASF